METIYILNEAKKFPLLFCFYLNGVTWSSFNQYYYFVIVSKVYWTLCNIRI